MSTFTSVEALCFLQTPLTAHKSGRISKGRRTVPKSGQQLVGHPEQRNREDCQHA
jgi:hypothetical protein